MHELSALLLFNNKQSPVNSGFMAPEWMVAYNRFNCYFQYSERATENITLWKDAHAIYSNFSRL